MAKVTYPAVLERGPEGGLGIWFPDFPGCVSAVDTLSVDDAQAAAEEALALHIEGMMEDGETLPRPSSIHAIGPEDGSDIYAVLIVSVKAAKAAPVSNVRVNVILPEPLLERIDTAASRLSMNRSSFLAEAARREIERSRLEIEAKRRS
jgi:predicted RNase H-like HicB family nuclease